MFIFHRSHMSCHLTPQSCAVTLSIPTTDTAHEAEINKPPGGGKAQHKAFRPQNFNEEIKTLYAEETHKAVVNTFKKKLFKNMFSLP